MLFQHALDATDPKLPYRQMVSVWLFGALLLLPLTSVLVTANATQARDVTPQSWALEDEAGGHFDDVTALSHSADGQWLASGGEDERLLVWDLQTWEVVTSFDCGVCWSIWDITFSPDSTMLAVTSEKGGLWVWDTNDWGVHEPGAGLSARSIAFSPDSSELIVTGTNAQGSPTITVLSTSEWTTLAEHPLPNGSPYSLALSPNGDDLMVGHTNGSIGVWSTSDWTRTHLLEHHTSQVTALGFSPDGTMAASGDFNSDLRLWNTENWSLSASDDVRYNSIHDVTFIDDNQLAVAYGGQLGIRTTDTLQETQTLFSNGQTQLRVVDLSPDRNSMMVGGETGSALLRYIDASTGGLLVEPQIHDRTVRAIATSNDGNLVATGDEGGRVVLWNGASVEIQHVLQADSEVGSVLFSPEGSTVYALTTNGSIHGWNTTYGTNSINLSTGSTDLAPDLLDLSPDGQILAAANLRSSAITIWRTSDWTEITSLSGVSWPQSIEFSPDGGLLAVGEGSTSVQGGEGQVHVWSTSTWSKETTVTGFDAEAYVQFSPDGSMLWISSAEGDWWDQSYVTKGYDTLDWALNLTHPGVQRVLGASADGVYLLHADCGGTLVNAQTGTTVERCIGGSVFSTSTFDASGSVVFGTAFPGVLQRMGSDSDEDGTPDTVDECPGTLPNVAVDDTGCLISDADTDGDGVLDGDDWCSLTRSNEAVDINGCSSRQRDGDNDNVNDLEDDCPGTPSGASVDEQGCEVQMENETSVNGTENGSQGTGSHDGHSSANGTNSSDASNLSAAGNESGNTSDSELNETVDPEPCEQNCSPNSTGKEDTGGALPWPGMWLSTASLVFAAKFFSYQKQSFRPSMEPFSKKCSSD